MNSVVPPKSKPFQTPFPQMIIYRLYTIVRGELFFFSFPFFFWFRSRDCFIGSERRKGITLNDRPLSRESVIIIFVVLCTQRRGNNTQCRALAYLFAPETWLMLILSPTYSQSNDNHRVNGHSRDILLTIFDFLLSSRKFQTRDSERANDHSDRLGSFFILPLWRIGR